jgi:signal transduction histidine kinase
VVEAHGGTITVEPGSRLGASPGHDAGPGVTFVVRLPVEGAPTPSEGARSGGEHGVGRKNPD